MGWQKAKVCIPIITKIGGKLFPQLSRKMKKSEQFAQRLSGGLKATSPVVDN